MMSVCEKLFEDDAPSALPKVEYAVPSKAEDWNGLILVGEAPGRDEVRLGQPFVGRSGQLLNGVLAQAGIERARCVVANVFRFQPPGNKVDHFFISKRAAQQQGVEIAENYGRFGSSYCRADFASEICNLAGTLKTFQARLPSACVVALGRTPFWALTGENGLLTHTGHMFDCRLAPGLKVLPTFHPSFILRGNWSLQPAWLEHFKAAHICGFKTLKMEK